MNTIYSQHTRNRLVELDQLVATLDQRIKKASALAVWYRGATEGVGIASRVLIARAAQ